MKTRVAIALATSAALALGCGATTRDAPPDGERRAYAPETDEKTPSPSGEPGGEGEGGPAPAIEADDPDEELASAMNAFASELWLELREDEGSEENLVMSPASVHVALSMALGGAAGETEEQLARALGAGDDPEAFHESVGAALFAWDGRGGDAGEQEDERDYELAVANRLFAEESYTWQEAFLELARGVYGAPLEELDFRGSPESSRRTINEWVEEVTEERIRDLLPAGSIHEDTRMVLTNAVYFLGDWVKSFDPEDTRDRSFDAPQGEREVEMMQQQSRFAYGEVEGARLLEMPYEGGDFGMLVALPREPDELEAVEDALSGDALAEWGEALSEREVNVVLPTYEIDPDESLALSPALERMGIRDAFSTGRADFSAMADPDENEGPPLYLEEVFHQAYVAVDEEGTEAAAATGAVAAPTAAPAEPPDVVDFVADRPFLFLVRDRESGAVLFMGRVTDPS